MMYEKLFAPDKIKHNLGSLAVALLATVLAGLLYLASVSVWLHPVTVAVLVAVTCVALSIEGEQWVTNREGAAVKREVSGWDVVATCWPGYCVAAVVEIAARFWLGA